ncbi:hypothetical protein O181_120556 [Austropuccinia psidii MF-1]|uniref:BED-type domain-containing protein n=1 Tax=Austropuccinia psidii MF-1 TaxID=1389203 RepID=A0A9Q3KIN3_9BASI|nr:hypothetical protein [Austropuccinia psidii MF-1]
MADDAISTAPPSRASTPSDDDPTSLTSSMEPLQSIKQSWVWNYFSDVDETYVECNVMNCGGQACKKRLKQDQTGSTKSMTHHLKVLHCLNNPKKLAQAISTWTLDQFVQPHIAKRPLSSELLKTEIVYFICDSNIPLSIKDSPSFQSLLELCNPNILNILVRRTAITSHLAEVFLFHQEHLQSTIFLQTHKVSFTTDV